MYNTNKDTYETLILSGGGIKGLSTLGCLQYLFDNKLIENENIKNYIGTSIGSIICLLIIIGYIPIEIVVYLCTNNILENFKPNSISDIIHGNGLYNFDNVKTVCEKMILSKMSFIPTLKELKDIFDKEFIICTYNLTKHKREYINYINYPNMSCLDAVRMSSNIPFIFNDFLYNENEYIDGGIIDNFPISVLNDKKFENKKAIGIYLHYSKLIKNDTGDNGNYSLIMKKFEKLYNILMASSRENKEISESVDLDIIKIYGLDDIQIHTFNISQTKKLELFSLGYNYAKHYYNFKEYEDTLNLRI
jgi:predicted acylesterase/phospholipase RssA